MGGEIYSEYYTIGVKSKCADAANSGMDKATEAKTTWTHAYSSTLSTSSFTNAELTYDAITA